MNAAKDDLFLVDGKKGILIVCEGISGCGKSESVQKLFGFLKAGGYKSAVIEWNSNEFIRKIICLLKEVNLLTPGIYGLLQWLSFLMDYFIKIKPLLSKNYILIADRYVYTALTRNIVNGAGGRISKMLCNKVRKPDLMFFHDTPPHICVERIKYRGKKLLHINKEIINSPTLKDKDLYYLEKLYRQYLKVMADLRAEKSTNIISVGDMDVDLQKYVERYIAVKCGGRPVNPYMVG